MKPNPTFERVCELLCYNPHSGLFTWRVSRGRVSKGQIAGTLDKDGYVVIAIDNKGLKAGRLAWFYMTGEWPDPNLDVEHHNGLNGDNSWNNLRLATRTQNLGNTRVYKNSKTGLKGAFPYRGRFRACIRIESKSHTIGYYNTAQEAHEAYCIAAKEHFGCFAKFS